MWSPFEHVSDTIAGRYRFEVMHEVALGGPDSATHLDVLCVGVIAARASDPTSEWKHGGVDDVSLGATSVALGAEIRIYAYASGTLSWNNSLLMTEYSIMSWKTECTPASMSSVAADTTKCQPDANQLVALKEVARLEFLPTRIT